MHATGPFDVRMTPQPLTVPDPLRSRMSLDKHYHGQLDATGVGEMLSGGDYKTGSAGYVAIETVTGTLDGKRGSFILQHNATMNRGEPQLNVIVVPDSATGDLTGLSGKLTIKIENKQHFYEFEYTLPVK